MSCSTDKARIAGGPVCAVEQCAHCGVLHITIGDAITLRLPPDAVASIAMTLSDVVRRLSIAPSSERQPQELPS